MPEKTFKKAGQLKENQYVLIDNEVCRIKSIEKSKPGKHGSTKARIVGIGVFDGQKRNLLKPTGDEIEVPIIEKGTAQIVAIMGDTLNLMDLASYETFNVKKPVDLPGIKQGMEAEYIRYGDKIRVLRTKKT